MSDIKLVSVNFQSRDKGGGQGQNGGTPPEGPSMDSRVTALETRLDTTLPTLATKADLAGVTAAMASLEGKVATGMADVKAEIHKWMLATVLGIFTAVIATVVGLNTIFKSGSQPQPQQAAPAPIIIQVPPYQPPAPPPQAPAKQ